MRSTGNGSCRDRLEDIAARTPETLWQLVERQVERLDGGGAGGAGGGQRCGGGVLGGGRRSRTGSIRSEGERRCEALARRGQFLRAVGVAEWPDGTVAGRYAFIHALYQQVLYARISIGLPGGTAPADGRASRARLRCAGGGDCRRARDAFRARQGFRAGGAVPDDQAGEHALRQHGYREADGPRDARRSELLKALPESPERIQRSWASESRWGRG